MPKTPHFFGLAAINGYSLIVVEGRNSANFKEIESCYPLLYRQWLRVDFVE